MGINRASLLFSRPYSYASDFSSSQLFLKEKAYFRVLVAKNRNNLNVEQNVQCSILHDKSCVFDRSQRCDNFAGGHVKHFVSFQLRFPQLKMYILTVHSHICANRCNYIYIGQIIQVFWENIKLVIQETSQIRSKRFSK